MIIMQAIIIKNTFGRTTLFKGKEGVNMFIDDYVIKTLQVFSPEEVDRLRVFFNSIPASDKLTNLQNG